MITSHVLLHKPVLGVLICRLLLGLASHQLTYHQLQANVSAFNYSFSPEQYEFGNQLTPLWSSILRHIRFLQALCLAYHCVVPENIHVPPREGFLFCTSSPPRKFQFSFILFF